MRKRVASCFILLDGIVQGPGPPGMTTLRPVFRLRRRERNLLPALGRVLYMIELRFRSDAALREVVQVGPDG